MNSLRSLALLAVTAMVAASHVQAQGEFEFTPFTGGTFFLSNPPSQFALQATGTEPLILQNASFDHAWTLGMNLGLRMNDDWALEGMFSWLPTQVAAEGLTRKYDVNGYMYGLTGLYYVPTHWPVRPFFGLGAGFDTFDYKMTGVKSDTEFMGNVVGGLFFPLEERLGIRVEVRDCFARFGSHVNGVANGWENDLMTNVGLSFRFPA